MTFLRAFLVCLIVIGAAATVSYELVAATTNWWPTISEAYWHLQDRQAIWALLIVIALGVLIAHFWFRLFRRWP